MKNTEEILNEKAKIEVGLLKEDGFATGNIERAMQAHTNQTLQELKAKVSSINNEIELAINSQKASNREIPDWLKGQSHAYNAIITLIDEAINE